MSRPNMQDIANSLSVSRVSVWKALSNRPGVSSELRKKVENEALRLGYFNKPKRSTGVLNCTTTVAVVVSRPESSKFWMQIIHQIAKELASFGVNLLYVYMPTDYTYGDILPANLSDGSVSGVIILNIYLEQQLNMLSQLDIPKVFLDSVPSHPPSKLNGDVVYIEGRASVREITENLLDSGFKKIGFIGDINHAQTNMDRFLGFVDAFANRKLDVNPTICFTGKLGINTHYEQIKSFINSLKQLPDCFICASDYLAHFVERYLEENSITSHICLTGFDNNLEYTNIAGKITTVDVQTSQMGERLANKILFKINHPNLPNEVSYVITNVIYRN